MFAIPTNGDVYGPFDVWGDKLLIRGSEVQSVGFEELVWRYFDFILTCSDLSVVGAVERVRAVRGFVLVSEGILCSMVPSKLSAVECFGESLRALGESLRALVQNAHRLESILSGCERCVGLSPGDFVSSSLDGESGEVLLRRFLGFHLGNWVRPWEGKVGVKREGKPVKSGGGSGWGKFRSSGFLGGNRVDVVGISDEVGEVVERLRKERDGD